MTDTQTDDDLAIAALQRAMETRTPAELMEACEEGDEEALAVVSRALVAIRRRLGLTVAEFMGRDLAVEMGMAPPVEH